MDKRKPIVTVTKADLIRQTFRAGGKGGQKQNKTESGVRFIHEPSGARGESREYREQPQNEKAAFKRLVETEAFQRWIKIETTRKLGNKIPETKEEILRRIDEDFVNGNVKTEFFDAGQ